MEKNQPIVITIPNEFKRLFDNDWREAAVYGGRYSLKSHTVARTLLIRAREKKLRKLGEKLLPKRFKILSFPHDQMPGVYTAADIFTYPTSAWESFGIVLAEAMASGFPVVATNDPIRKEIIGRAGALVNPKDTAAYSIALENALKLKWGKRPLNQAKKFDWDKIAVKYEKLFLELVK